MKTLLKNGKLISDNRIQEADLLIENERIAKIATDISAKEAHRVIDHYEIGRASLGKECRSRWSPYH